MILTHHHVDHIGLTAEIVARSGAEVLTHSYNQPWLDPFPNAKPIGEGETLALDGRALTLWELTQPIFPKLRTGMDYFLGLSEIQGHLDLLAEDSRVEAVSADGVLRWRSV